MEIQWKTINIPRLLVQLGQCTQRYCLTRPSSLIQDFHLIDKLSHFDAERIPERVVHAKGAAAHGYFEVTSRDIAKICKAKFLDSPGKKTPVFLRFSTVGGEKGSADTERDPRGFAIKFYTEEGTNYALPANCLGNWDMVGNNTPVFFIRDPIKFPDFIHTQKKNPRTNLKDPDMYWDFLSLVPESIHQVTILFSDRGTPDGYRHMDGFSSHTFKLISPENQIHFAKFHFKTDQRIKNFTTESATEMAGKDPDYATRDLFNAIEKGNFPSWTVYIQLMTPDQATKYRWNILDVTKVWPHKDFPLIPIGKLVLNRNPDNYFAETEQSAFSPSHLVPGIEASFDKMLQGRLFSYPDTHRHRLGVNYKQIPINQPRNAQVVNHQRDGFMTVNSNGGSLPNYEPNSIDNVKQLGLKFTGVTYTPEPVSGTVIKHPVSVTDDDFVQAGALYKLQPEDSKTRLIGNIAGHLGNAKPHIIKRQLENFKRANADYGRLVELAVSKASSRI